VKKTPVNIDRLIKIISALSLLVAGMNVYFCLHDDQESDTKNRSREFKEALSEPTQVNPATGRLVVGFARGPDSKEHQGP